MEALSTMPIYTDANAGLELITDESQGIPLEATRYIFTPGDYLDPARKDQLEHLRRGGEELLGNPCLRRTTNRFLPRCAITPLEFWGEEMPWDLFPKEGTSVRPPVKLRGVEKQESAGRLFPELFFYPHFPGELVRDAVDAGNESRGIVEISYLRGVEWEKGEAQAIQQVIFPDDWTLPVELRLVEERIQRAADANTATIKDICGEMLDGCAKFRRYAHRMVDRENTQVAQRVHAAGHVYSYTAMGRSFAAQLEIKLTATVQESVGSELARALATFGGNQQLGERDVQVIAVAVGEAVKQAMASLKAEPPAVEPPEAKKPSGKKSAKTETSE